MGAVAPARLETLRRGRMGTGVWLIWRKIDISL